jgi:hypothetical protein
MKSPIVGVKNIRSSEKKPSKNNTKKLGQLQESILIKKTLVFFILPNVVLGVVALFSQYFYMLIPVYET